MTSNIKEMTINLRLSKYMYINESESKNMHEKRYGEIGTYKHAINISVDKTSCISSDNGFMGLIRLGNNSNKETLIYIPHNWCHHHLSPYNLSYP